MLREARPYRSIKSAAPINSRIPSQLTLIPQSVALLITDFNRHKANCGPCQQRRYCEVGIGYVLRIHRER